MSRHPGQPTDDEQDAAAEAFYGGVMPRTPAPLTVEQLRLRGRYAWQNLTDPDGNVVAEFREEADARAFVALPALQERCDKLQRLVEQHGKLVAWMLGEDGEFEPPPTDWQMRKYKPWYWWRSALRDRYNELLTNAAALAQADGPKEQP